MQLDIPEHLRAWRPVIERQANMALSPLHQTVRSLRVAFREVQPLDRQTVCYRCELSGRGHNGTVYRAEAQHPDGRIAIADAFARARRAIARDRRRGARV